MPLIATRRLDPSMTAATPTIAQSACRRLNLTYAAELTLGTRTSVISSPGWREVVRYPVNRSPASIVRLPLGPCTATEPPRASSSVGRSPWESACASDPPIVPRFRTCGSPIPAAVSASTGQPDWIVAESATSRWVVIAPTAR